MKEIAYAGRTVCTSDEVGTLVVKISALLAKRNIAEALSVPIRADDGVVIAEFVVGLGNDVLATPHTGDEDEALNGTPEAQRLRERLEELTGTSAGAVATRDDIDELDFL